MPTTVQLQVDTPCHENWQQMTPNEQGRYCMACQKTVVDFSLMSDKEILEYISKANTGVCGRFTDDQLNRDINKPTVKKRFSWAYVWNVIVATFLLATQTNAQTKRLPLKKTVASQTIQPVLKYNRVFLAGEVAVRQSRSITGIITDAETQQPIPFASVMVKGTQQGVSADSSGKFIIPVPNITDSTQLQVSALNYANAFYAVTDESNLLLITLSPVAKELKPVVVVCDTDRRRMGAGMIIMHVSITERVKRTFDNFLPKNDVKIYPNPVAPGNTINVALSLKEAGEYSMALLDASGRVVLMQPIVMNTKEQTLGIATNAAWNKGIYWLRISGRHTNQIYQAKVLLQ